MKPDDESPSDPVPSMTRILEAVHARPGASAQEIADLVGLSWSTVKYHIRQLVKERQLVAARRGRQMQIFPAEVPEVHRTWLAALNDRPTARVLHALLEAPGRRIPHLSRQLGIEQRLLRRHLMRLERGNLVRRSNGRGAGFQATPAPEWARQKLATLLGIEPVVGFDLKQEAGEASLRPNAGPLNPGGLGQELKLRNP